tara:strand:+ start:1956 stop:2696 length:741 start_codon:yes stop_codon:yes gene_type:complete
MIKHLRLLLLFGFIISDTSSSLFAQRNNVKKMKRKKEIRTQREERTNQFEKTEKMEVLRDSLRLIEEEKLRIRIEEDCEKNKNIKILMLPFVNDFYGLTDDSENAYKSVCFDVNQNIKALEYLNDNKLTIENLNDYHLKEIGQLNNVDFVFHGYTYVIDVPYKNSPIVSKNPLNDLAESYDSVFDWNDGYFFRDLATVWIYRQETKEKSYAIKEAGVYVVVTYFSLNIKTGEKKYILKNERIIKLG